MRWANCISTPRRSRLVSLTTDAHAYIGGNLQPVDGVQDEVGDAVSHVATGGVRPAELT